MAKKIIKYSDIIYAEEPWIWKYGREMEEENPKNEN